MVIVVGVKTLASPFVASNIVARCNSIKWAVCAVVQSREWLDCERTKMAWRFS
jgi:hypothetical protein